MSLMKQTVRRHPPRSLFYFALPEKLSRRGCKDAEIFT